MVIGKLIHPHILSALAGAGHGSQVLISDGNYPNATECGPNAQRVYLNLSPDMFSVCDVLRVLTAAIPIEAATVMATSKTGPHAQSADPDIWQEFREILQRTDCHGKLNPVERFAFYDAARSPASCLLIATGEQRIYANLLLTIGIVKAAP